MLTITVNEDRSITVTSDDGNAENAVVMDALEMNAGELCPTWEDAPFTDGALAVKFEGDDADLFLRAIDGWEELSHAQDAIEEAMQALNPHVGGGPKPGAHAG